MQTKTEEHF